LKAFFIEQKKNCFEKFLYLKNFLVAPVQQKKIFNFEKNQIFFLQSAHKDEYIQNSKKKISKNLIF
jgi:hypothetical protein